LYSITSYGVPTHLSRTGMDMFQVEFAVDPLCKSRLVIVFILQPTNATGDLVEPVWVGYHLEALNQQ
jgi:hypothetical protein